MGKDSSDKTALGDRLKGYEAQFESRIDEKDNIVVRIDGHKFSKFTKGFKRPYDDLMTISMEKTTLDLVERFAAYAGYTQSDEITLFIPSLINLNKAKAEKIGTPNMLKKDINHIFDGRVQKLTSLIAAYTSIRFNYWFERTLKHAIDNTVDENYTESLKLSDEEIEFYQEKVGQAYFDARVYGTHEDDVVNSFLWRIRDCTKNSKSMFAQTYCSHKDLMYKTGDQQVSFCEETTGNKWTDLSDRFKFGVMVKRVEHKVNFENEYSSGSVTRNRIMSFPASNYKFDELKKIVLSKSMKERDYFQEVTSIGNAT